MPIDLLVAYGLANILAAIPITPGGLGVVEFILSGALVGFGVPGLDRLPRRDRRGAWSTSGCRSPSAGLSYLSLRLARAVGRRLDRHATRRHRLRRLLDARRRERTARRAASSLSRRWTLRLLDRGCSRRQRRSGPSTQVLVSSAKIRSSTSNSAP